MRVKIPKFADATGAKAAEFKLPAPKTNNNAQTSSKPIQLRAINSFKLGRTKLIEKIDIAKIMRRVISLEASVTSIKLLEAALV